MYQAFAALDPATALPFDLGGDFTLTDQTGATRTQANPDGLKARGLAARPVMITGDPKCDTVENMGPALARLHPDFVGLIGTTDQLDHVYKLLQVSHTA
ncbi:hypothetical protein MNBD_ALPHA07-1012 [hydrothermal vent metagenome]|uniref:Uncharacterized protein n=1 Tax=hydrothermal vent metagenome TaxID=652676 RepID=A0A3B0RIJ1_9ZZZZ